jgi:hypothetical protein
MIYLEPRATFDAAIIEHTPKVIYDYVKLIDILCLDMSITWLEAVDYYCYNIEYLIWAEGLIIKDD